MGSAKFENAAGESLLSEAVGMCVRDGLLQAEDHVVVVQKASEAFMIKVMSSRSLSALSGDLAQNRSSKCRFELVSGPVCLIVTMCSTLSVNLLQRLSCDTTAVGHLALCI